MLLMRIDTLRERLRALGANPRHEQRELRHFLSARLVAELPIIERE